MTADNLKTNDVEITEDVSFRDMMLSKQVLAGLTKCNFEKPSPIQLRAIPIGRCGLDLIIQSKSGTGKTLVFCTIILERFNPNVKAPQSLIVVPTREIALQVETYLNSIGVSCPGFSVTSVIGGRDIAEDRKRINKCKAIVGTPGRILHLIKNKFVCLQNIQTLVLDEADKLVTDDFYNDINILLDALNTNRQIIASSATYANGLDKLIVSFMHNPIAISTSRDTPVLIGVKQFILPVDGFSVPKSVEHSTPSIQSMWRKVSAVEYILSTTAFKQCILFSNSQFRANSFANYLTQNQWTVELVLGSHDQDARTATLQKFREYKCRILVTSDLMARGVDIVNVNLVINLDVPSDSSTYLHRIGRCGRFGRRGLAITLASDDNEMNKFRNLLGIIGGDKMKVATFPTNLNENVKFDAWNSNESEGTESDSYIFGVAEKNVLTEMKQKQHTNSDDRFKPSPTNESDAIERKNINLLEVARLLVDTKTTAQNTANNIDINLFDSFQSSNVADNAQPQIEISVNMFEEFAQSINGSNDTNEVENGSNVLLENGNGKCEMSKEQIETTDKNHTENVQGIITDAKTNHTNETHQKNTPQKSAEKRKVNQTNIQLSTSNNGNKYWHHWSKLYWQQFNDINQYVANAHYMNETK